MDAAPFPLDPPLSPEDFDAPLFESFDAQVAGHPSTVFRTRGGQVIVKRSLPTEIGFYYRHFNPCTSSSGPSLEERLTLLTPKCHGAVTLSEPVVPKAEKGRVKLPAGAVAAPPLLPELVDLRPVILPGDSDSDDGRRMQANALVLENVLHGFVAPNVLDIKLGTQLWDESATEDKKLRMIQAAQTCTSAEFGLRLTGWQTWDEAEQKPFNVSKLFGKNIMTRSELELGARIFFCSARSTADAEAYSNVLHKGADDVPDDAVKLPVMPRDLIHAVVSRGLVPQLEHIISLVKDVEWRVRGGSVLLVYEGSLAALERKLDDPNTTPTSYCKARLIDFAHASFVPGQGPDAGYLQGLDVALSLLQHVALETAPAPAS